MKIAALTQIRNESKRLREWVDFHSKFHGIEYFYFYLDHPDDDTENTIVDLSKEYNIGYKFTDSSGSWNRDYMAFVNRQKDSFTEGFNQLKHEYDWIIIFDVDEWIVPVDIENYDLKKWLNESNRILNYLPMYNFTPPFDYEKSITEQNFYRWNVEERISTGHGLTGKSIIKGKMLLDKHPRVDIHCGPDLPEYQKEMLECQKEALHGDKDIFRLHQWQCHMIQAQKIYAEFDDSLKRMLQNGANQQAL